MRTVILLPMADRSFSECDLPAKLTLHDVREHLRHYANCDDAVLPAAFMLKLRVQLRPETAQLLGASADLFDSDEQLRQHPSVELVCINILRALIGMPAIGGCVIVNESRFMYNEMHGIHIIGPKSEDIRACVYVDNKTSLVVAM